MREKGDVLSCLSKLIHHVSPNKTRLILYGVLGCDLPELREVMEYRNSLVREEAEIAEKKLRKILTVAQEKGYQEIIDIINEEVEFGHNFDTEE